MNENPGAYQESKNRIRESENKEKRIQEEKREYFEVSKERLHKSKKFDVFGLKNRIETGHSLALLKEDLKQALAEGNISLETYTDMLKWVENKEKHAENNAVQEIDFSEFPLFQNRFAQFLEKQPLGENIVVDTLGFLYGFFAQGSALLVIIAWRLLEDILLLPRDIYHKIRKPVL